VGPVFRIVYDGLRGFGALIEGAEFLFTHRHLWRPLALHLGTAATLVLLTGWLRPPLATTIAPYLPAVVAPWYLVLAEWAWGAMPSVLASLAVSGLVTAAYSALAWPTALVARVAAIRAPGKPGTPTTLTDRMAVLVWLAAGGLVCSGVVVLHPLGAAVAVFLACPVLGIALIYPALRLRGWAPREARRFALARLAIWSGLGTGLAIGLAVPLVSLAALPCGMVGAACLALREERPRPS
jgi:hypothetical protein